MWSYIIIVLLAACYLRLKIAAVVAKGGIADPDCPTDPMSTRYWVHLGMEEETQDKSTSTVTVEGAVHGNNALAALGSAQLSSGAAAVPAPADPLALVRSQLVAAEPPAASAPATPSSARGTIAASIYRGLICRTKKCFALFSFSIA